MDPAPVFAYHQRTKHRFEAYASGPDSLDWDDQPAAFRRFDGANSIVLPTLQEAMRDPQLAEALHRPLCDLGRAIAPATVSTAALGVLLQLSLGITAWKSYGPERWAVRANPSSGNLHPVEAYLFLRGVAGFADGLYHYCPDTHALECRAEFAPSDGAPQLLVALSSVMWREAWKYGERAFRYCQLDTGHAVGALRYAAALLGWPAAEQRQADTTTLAHWLGLDRAEDFAAGRVAYTEREEAEILLSLLPGEADIDWLERTGTTAEWHGSASAIDRHPMYRWPIIDEIAAASRHAKQSSQAAVYSHVSADTQTAGMPAAQLILQRRSAQRFDARHIMSQQDFFALLETVLPDSAIPWDTLETPPRIGLALFVHRVEGLSPGLYLLPRQTSLEKYIRSDFLRAPVENAPPHLNLQLLTPAPPAELHRAARSINCHQDIASNSCFALGMLAEFEASIDNDPSAYRDLHREAGLIGQVLYLHAERLGLRGTGIGCYFDDPFHSLLGLEDKRFQSLYHFTVGLSLEDTRIETSFVYDLGEPP
jgi:SagB-type dehydrogenase family enzyme